MKVTTPVSVTYREAAGFFLLAMRGASLAIDEHMRLLIDGGGLGIQSARPAKLRLTERHTRNSGIGGSIENKKPIAGGLSVAPNQKNAKYPIKIGGAVEEKFSHQGDLPAGVVTRRVPFSFAFFHPGRNQRFRADYIGHAVVVGAESLRGDR